MASFRVLVYISIGRCELGCQYQSSLLSGKTRLRNDLLCVKCGV